MLLMRRDRAGLPGGGRATLGRVGDCVRRSRGGGRAIGTGALGSLVAESDISSADEVWLVPLPRLGPGRAPADRGAAAEAARRAAVRCG